MVFPNLYIIGSHKAGTTSLVEALSLHSEIYFPSVKEPSYFYFFNKRPCFQFYDKPDPVNRTPYFSENKYLSLYKRRSERFLGDASTFYSMGEGVARRISKASPEAKIVYVIRDPVSRAYSAYNYMRKDLKEEESFFDALEIENFRLSRGYSPDWAYVNNGYYSKVIGEYSEIFRSNLKVVLFEDLVSRTRETVSEILIFLGLEVEEGCLELKSHNAAGIPVTWSEKALRRFFNSNSRVKSALKHLMPIKLRRLIAIKLLYGRRTTGMAVPKRLAESEKAYIYKKYYLEEVDTLERVLARKLSGWRYD